MPSFPARGVKRAASESPPAEALSTKNGFASLPPRPAAVRAAEGQDPSAPLLPSDPSPSTWHLSLAPRHALHWSKNRALFQQPEQITTFSYDGDRRLHHDDRSLMHFHLPPPNADLNRGYGQHISKDDTRNEHLDALCYSLMELGRDEALDRARRRADVVTWRGMATRMCTALYEQRDGWEMNAMLVQGTMYIEEHLSPQMLVEKAQRRQGPATSSREEGLARLTYHGSSFESWSTHTPSSRPFDYARDNPWSGTPNTNTQWCSVVKTRLGSSRLILGGEVDCVDERGQKVELKTSMVIRNERDTVRFEEKMLRFYMQSFLLGVGRVLVGFRDAKSGRLQATHDFSTLEMPKLVRGKPYAWDPQAGLNLADAMLNFVRETILQDEEAKRGGRDDSDAAESNATPPVYRLSFSPTTHTLSVTRLTPQQVSNEVVGKSEGDIERVGFLPQAFYEWAMQRERPDA